MVLLAMIVVLMGTMLAATAFAADLGTSYDNGTITVEGTGATPTNAVNAV